MPPGGKPNLFGFALPKSYAWWDKVTVQDLWAACSGRITLTDPIAWLALDYGLQPRLQ